MTADLNKVATAQGKAQADINQLNEGSGDAAILNTLKTTFEGGAATNANALGHVSSAFLNLAYSKGAPADFLFQATSGQ